MYASLINKAKSGEATNDILPHIGSDYKVQILEYILASQI
jgi:hypothetical protein